MTEPDLLRVFVDGRALSLRRPSTVVEAIRAFDAGVAGDVLSGLRAVTDSRGLPIALDAHVTGGTVLRVVSARAVREPATTGP